MTAPRLPLAPLLAALDCTGPAELARLLDTNHSTIRKWKQRGIAWESADRVAVSAGLHPAAVWPEWLDHSIALNAGLCDAPSLTRYTRQRCRCHGCRDEATRYQRARRARQAEAVS